MSVVTLAALELLEPSNWSRWCADLLTDAGMGVVRTGSSIQAWKGADQKSLSSSLSWVEGFSLSRIWLGPRSSALGINPRCLYFRGDSTTPTQERERALLAGTRRPRSLSDADLLVHSINLLEAMRSASSGRLGELVQLEQAAENLDERCLISIGNNRMPARNGILNSLYRRLGFDQVPNGFSIRISPSPDVRENTADAFVRRFEAVMSARGIEPRVRLVSTRVLLERIADIERGDSTRQDPAHVLLLVLPGKSEPLDRDTRGLLGSLDRHNISWRRAYADDPLEFSIPDQLPSLLQAAGGRPHRIEFPAGTPPLWSLGIDISHKLNAVCSTLCLTLVDPEGSLRAAWRGEQGRDETVSMDLIAPMLNSAAQLIENGDKQARVLAIRDGRLFEGEEFRLYRDALGLPLSLVECRKGGNPALFFSTSSGPRLPAAATWATTRRGNSGFLVTNPMRARKTMDRVLKISWQEAWDGLSLGPAGIGSALTALSFTPGLGLRRRTMPAPIYWADGIAGADDSDLRFRGQRIAALKDPGSAGRRP